MEQPTGSTWILPTCKAEGLPLCEPELKIVEKHQSHVRVPLPRPARTLECDCVLEKTSTTLEDMDWDWDAGADADDTDEPPTNDDEMQLEDIRTEVERQQERVEEIDQAFGLGTCEVPEVEPKIDLEVELNGDNVQPEILDLQRSNHKLRQQLNELKQCCIASDAMIKKLRTGLNRGMSAVQQLQRQIDQMDSLQRNLEHEKVLCSQRYHYLMNELYDWDECHKYIAAKQKSSEKDLNKFVARIDYKKPKHEALDRLNQAKQHIKDVHAMIQKRWNSLGPVESLVPNSRMGTEINTFLLRNMQLFSKESH